MRGRRRRRRRREEKWIHERRTHIHRGGFKRCEAIEDTKVQYMLGLGPCAYLPIPYYHHTWVPNRYVLQYYKYCDTILQFIAIFKTDMKMFLLSFSVWY